MSLKTIITAIAIVVVLLLIVLGARPSSATKDHVLVFGNEQIEQVEVPSGKVSVYDDSFEDLLTYTGLPANYKTATSSAFSTVLVRADEDRYAFVVWSRFEDPLDTPFGPTPLDSRYFLCDAVRKGCEPADYFVDLQKTPANAWLRWNRTKRLLAGHASGEGVGNSTPVVIASLPDENGNMQVASTTYGIGDARVPSGNFSPSLSQFLIQVNENATSTALALYSSDDLLRSKELISIQTILDASGDYTVRSLAWSQDERKIAIGMQKQIYLYDFMTKKFTLLFDDTTPTGVGVDWEWNELRFTESGRYIVFQDLLELNPGGNGFQSMLRAIDLNSKKIVDIVANKSLVWWEN